MQHLTKFVTDFLAAKMVRPPLNTRSCLALIVVVCIGAITTLGRQRERRPSRASAPPSAASRAESRTTRVPGTAVTGGPGNASYEPPAAVRPSRSPALGPQAVCRRKRPTCDTGSR